MLGLLELHGPFTLAYLEALLRAADQRASRILGVADPLLQEDNSDDELETGNRDLATTAGGGASAASPGGNTPSRSALDAGGGRAGGRGADSDSTGGEAGGSTQPFHATRHLETTLGILSYRELAPHLSERVVSVELEILDGAFSERPLDEALILDIHTRLCSDLTPAMAGRWRGSEVRVGTHLPPSPYRLAPLMRDYALDLAARMQATHEAPGERLLEVLAFAEGRLLHIHPFEDFNGRVSRLFLIELLQRLALPVVTLAPQEGAATQRYFDALRAFDHNDPRGLIALWQERFERGED